MTTTKTKTDSTTQRIAELNDLCRKAFGLAERVFQTEGICALPQRDQSAIREKMELFDSFTEENDPHGEHGPLRPHHSRRFSLRFATPARREGKGS